MERGTDLTGTFYEVLMYSMCYDSLSNSFCESISWGATCHKKESRVHFVVKANQLSRYLYGVIIEQEKTCCQKCNPVEGIFGPFSKWLPKI